MSAVTAREALAYALSRELAILYAVVLGGYVALLFAGWFASGLALRGGGGGFLGQLLAAGLFLVGFVAVLGGLIGFVYKVIADANRAARS
ncbi:hypothetical protein [Halobellus marinus]|jgi:hypothetical protein|uniref:hypothetical protein n=1 Tax=Halobellus TaxID=1073986 RepID=UPI0028A70098|nr:hypothetical protein [Halobellus sp. DFY28]